MLLLPLLTTILAALIQLTLQQDCNPYSYTYYKYDSFKKKKRIAYGYNYENLCGGE